MAQRGEEILINNLETKVRQSVFMKPSEMISVSVRCFEVWGLRMRTPNSAAYGQVRSHYKAHVCHSYLYNIETELPLLNAGKLFVPGMIAF